MREFRVVENCHLGNNIQSEHCMQQINRSKRKGQAKSRLGELGPLTKRNASSFFSRCIRLISATPRVVLEAFGMLLKTWFSGAPKSKMAHLFML